MASHVVVVDSTARRTVVKVSPNQTPQRRPGGSLRQAWSDSYQVWPELADRHRRHNNKVVDLSRTFRLSGLSSGAKLELVQLSRSASIVSVALQLPESDGSRRLTDKFPSTTTLWMLLRKFEAGVAGDSSARLNLTARAAPGMSDDGNSGAGRLYYQTPVIRVMGRELSSFTDLQKTLAQLGFNSGSTLLILSFRTSEISLEEAMAQSAQYFQSTEDTEDFREGSEDTRPNRILSEPKNAAPTESSEGSTPLHEPAIETPSTEPESTVSESSASLAGPQLPANPTTSPPSRPIQIFSPPTSDTPSAVRMDHNPADYVPTIEHAKAHQEHLRQRSQNTRLLSETELASQKAAEAERLKSLPDVETKIRFPDQSSAVTTFGHSDTGADLYAFVRDDCLDERFRAEKFLLTYLPASSPSSSSLPKGWTTTIPDDATKTLIHDLGFKGRRFLITFKWDDSQPPSTAGGRGASLTALQTKDVLKKERRAQAQALPSPPLLPPSPLQGGDEEGTRVDLTGSKGDESDKSKKKGLPKWLKLPGKK